jgi:hypothetical protein
MSPVGTTLYTEAESDVGSGDWYAEKNGGLQLPTAVERVPTLDPVVQLHRVLVLVVFLVFATIGINPAAAITNIGNNSSSAYHLVITNALFQPLRCPHLPPLSPAQPVRPASHAHAVLNRLGSVPTATHTQSHSVHQHGREPCGLGHSHLEKYKNVRRRRGYLRERREGWGGRGWMGAVRGADGE